MSNNLKEYIVTLKDRTDLDQFYLDMENENSLNHIPSRPVECAFRRPNSRNTHYYLSFDEAENLKEDPRVLSVSLTLKDLDVKTVFHSEQTANWSRSTTPEVGQKNWGLYRITKPSNISQWGSESGTGNLTATARFDATGANVDIVIVDDIAYPDHSEYSERFNQYDWFGEHDLAVRGTGSIIAFVSRSSNQAVITTQTAHKIVAGARVTINCTSDPSFNATNALVTAVSSSVSGGPVNRFAYSNTGGDVTTTSATGNWVGVYQYGSYFGENNHATHVTSIAAGATQGMARGSNLYNLRHDTKGENPGQYTPSEFVIDYVRQFHANKPINPETGRKNPTLVNCSWGIGKDVYNQLNGVTENNRFTAINYRGQTVTPTGLGNPEVDTGYSGVCNPFSRLATLSNVINGGNRIETTSSSVGTCTSIPKNILGRSGLVDLGAPTGFSENGVDQYDDAFWYIEPPFDIDYAGATYGPTGTGGLNINISSNSSILFGGTGIEAYDTFVGAAGPAIRKIHISANDRSCQKVLAGTSGLSPNRTFRVRWEGHDSPAGGVVDSPTVVWEATFYEATPNRIDLHIDQNAGYRGEFTVEQLQQYGIMQSGYKAPYRDAAIDADIEDAIDEGIIFVSSAGNGGFKLDVSTGQDYNNYFVDNGIPYYYHRGTSPGASHPDMICVGALDSTSEEGRFNLSNTGPRVDLYAPGANVIGAVYDDSGFPVGASQTVVNDGETVLDLVAGTTLTKNGTTGIVTITTTTAHGLTSNSLATIKIVTTGFEFLSASQVIINVATPNSFTYQGSVGSSYSNISVTGTVKIGYLFQKYNGTSVSAAQVTGMVALLLERYPDLTQADVKKLVLQYARDGQMFETSGSFEDAISLLGGPNKIAFYFKDRLDEGSVYPKTNEWMRPTSGMVYPRPKIYRS